MTSHCAVAFGWHMDLTINSVLIMIFVAFFKEERKIYIEKLETSPILSDQYIPILRNPEFLTQLTLDATVISGLR